MAKKLDQSANPPIPTITQAEWDKISDDFKDVWQAYFDDRSEWLGRKTIVSTCITNDYTAPAKLLIQDVHFKFIEK
jgi:hypothetical protein